MSAENNSTVIFPVPLDILSNFMGKVEKKGKKSSIDGNDNEM